MKRMLILLAIMILLVGCRTQTLDNEDKKETLDFNVMDPDEVPEEVMTMIENQKEDPFKFSYTDGENLYIVVGYGEQPTGGYSVQVLDVYLTGQSVVIETELLGPSKEDVVTMVLTYPYVIVRTEHIDLPVYYK